MKKMFKRIPLNELIDDELYEAERKLLAAETALEFATSEVGYQKARIARLKERKNAENKVVAKATA
jgi:hypothetical protein